MFYVLNVIIKFSELSLIIFLAAIRKRQVVLVSEHLRHGHIWPSASQ